MSKANCSSNNNIIFNSRKNILELMENQGYNVDDYKNVSINEIHTMFQNKQLDLLLEKKNKKTFIKYHLAKTLRGADIYEMIDSLFETEEILTKIDDLVIIIKDEPNEPLLNVIKYIWEKDKYFITIFNIKKLQFNILKHSYVPKHIILNKEEEETFRKKYNIQSNSEIAEISRFDPVAMAIGLRKNQICKILRNSKTAIVTDFYRICC